MLSSSLSIGRGRAHRNGKARRCGYLERRGIQLILWYQCKRSRGDELGEESLCLRGVERPSVHPLPEGVSGLIHRKLRETQPPRSISSTTSQFSSLFANLAMEEESMAFHGLPSHPSRRTLLASVACLPRPCRALRDGLLARVATQVPRGGVSLRGVRLCQHP